ncbi:MAG: hypothetical protein ORN27_11780, partial [Rhodoluna sp.]|nr:hypothetical protein [Rhodoluna sp.]
VNQTITSTTSITLTAPKLTFSATKVTGAAPVLIQPYGTSFTTALDTASLQVGTDVTSFTVGRDTDGATAQTGGSVTLNNESWNGTTSTVNVTKVAGPIKIFADNITVGSALENTVTTAGKNNILLKATQNILINLAYTVKAAGGDVVFWSNSDGSADGNIIGSTGAITTNGGNFVAAGGSTTDANGYPNGYARALDVSGRYGIQLNGSVTTGGGKVTLLGEGPGGAVNGVSGGVQLDTGASITTGAGDVTITGRTASTNTYGSPTYGIWVGNNSTAIGITTTSGNITLNGDASNNTTYTYRRGVLLYPATITSGTGNISITGKATNTTGSYDVWSYPTTNANSVTSTSGTVTITGTGDGATMLEKCSIGTSTLTTITGKSVSFGASSSLTGTGPVVIEPTGTNWIAETNTVNTDGSVDLSGVTVTTGKSSFRVGKYNSSTSHSTKTITLPSLSVAGPISVYGGDIALGATTSVTSTSDNLMIKATGSITVAATPTVSTKSGDLTLWADSDANKSGAISLGTSTTSASVTTTGGVITLAGGADDGATIVESGRTSADNRPDGWAYGTSATGTTNNYEMYGVAIGQNSTISTTNADIFIAGQMAESRSGTLAMGVRMWPGTQVTAGTGRVHAYGKGVSATGSYNYGLMLGGGSSTRAGFITTTGTQSDSIVIKGEVDGTASRAPGLVLASGTSYTPTGNYVANTSSGGITLVGKSPSGTTTDTTDTVGDGIEIGKFGAYSKSGTITLNGETSAATSSVKYGMSFAHNSTFYTGVAEFGASQSALTLNSVDMTSSSANIALNADSYSVTTNPTIKTTGTFSMSTPTGYSSNSFDRAVTMSKFTINSVVTGITVGNPGNSGSDQNTANVTVDTTYSIAGPIAVYGGDITISNSQTSTLLNAKLTYKATGKIVTAAGTSAAAPFVLRTNKGDLTLWSNAAGTATNGSIFVDKYNYLDTTNNTGTSMTTGGGRISIAGGLNADLNGVPTGYATSDTAADGAGGVALGTATTGGGTGWLKMYSGGGDITVRGSSSQAKGILAPSGYDINAGEGAIVLDGKSTGTTASYNGEGVELAYGGTVSAASSILSAKSTGTAISITGYSTATSSFGVISNNWSTSYVTTIGATGGGNIVIKGTGPTDGQFKYNNILANGGDITFDMSTNGATFANCNVGKLAGSAVTADSGNIIYDGDKYTGASSNAFANSGYAWIQTSTSAKTIDLGGADSSTNLGVSNAELAEFSGQSAVRVGTIYSGNVTVTANISMTGKTLAVRTGGNFTANTGISITAANLAISAAGTISMPGSNNVPGNLALAATGATASYTTSVNYTPATVDSVDPIFGIVKDLSISGVPSGVAAQTEYIGVNITGPPTATLKDKYSNTLDAYNQSQSNYTVTASVSGGPTLSG